MKNKTYVKAGAKPKAATVKAALKGLLEGPDRERLYLIAFKLCRDVEQANELVQEACYRALANAARYDEGQPLFNWVAVILRNAFISSTRRVRPLSLDSTAEHQNNDDRPEPLWAQIAEKSETALEEIERDAERVAILGAFSKLSDEQERVIILCDLRGEKMTDAARELGLSVGTVKSRLCRGRAKLRRALGGSR